MANQNAQMDSVFRALADPTRRAVVQRLTEGAASVSDLAAPFDIALPSFMQHLKILEQSGLVISRKQGRVRICKLVTHPLSDAERWISHQRAVWAGRFDRLDRVLAEMAEEERLDDQDL